MAKFCQTITTKRSESFVARSYCEDDYEAFRKFLEQGALESTHTLVYRGYELPFSTFQNNVKRAVSSTSEIYVGVFNEERVIGSLHFRVPLSEHPWVKHIGEFGMMISEEYWGQGIGSVLLEVMESFAKSVGILRIEARVRTTNSRGVNLYTKMGYIIEGTRKNAAFINGQFEDEFYLVKFL